LDDKTREQMIGQLDELRAELQSSGARDSLNEVTLLEQVEDLQALVTSERDTSQASKVARVLERRLLAWEAEHPQLAALAARVARALESSGL
jgi:hypothetical protein